MMILRGLLALAVALQALSSFFPLLGNALYKSGLLGGPVTGPAARMVPLWNATPWWQLAIWLLGILLLLMAAWRLIRWRGALAFYAAGIAVSMGLNAMMQQGAVYQAVFRDAPSGFGAARLAILLLGGAMIWWVEQQPARPNAATRT